MKKSKVYLGNSVYADNDGFRIILTTENGYGATNTIYLDGNVLDELMDYFERMKTSK